jgi:hypothetical protein
MWSGGVVFAPFSSLVGFGSADYDVLELGEAQASTFWPGLRRSLWLAAMWFVMWMVLVLSYDRPGDEKAEDDENEAAGERNRAKSTEGRVRETSPRLSDGYRLDEGRALVHGAARVLPEQSREEHAGIDFRLTYHSHIEMPEKRTGESATPRRLAAFDAHWRQQWRHQKWGSGEDSQTRLNEAACLTGSVVDQHSITCLPATMSSITWLERISGGTKTLLS